MKLSALLTKLQNKSDDEIIDYLDSLYERDQYKKIELDGKYVSLFSFDPDDGTISWECPDHGYCEADLSDLFLDHAKMLHAFENHGCGLEEA